MVSSPEEGGNKEESYEWNNNIISNSNQLNILPPHLKNISACHKVMCGF